MKIKITGEKIEFDKELNYLDHLVFDFVKVLEKFGVEYVLVSGYVSILFGRSRSSEDIDIILERVDESLFGDLWRELNSKNFECIITGKKDDAYKNYLSTGHSIRFSRKGEFIPNVEIKFPKVGLDRWVLRNRKKVILNGQLLYISPIELQIPFKLFLGGEKDIEDAKHLYNLFKDHMDAQLFMKFLREFDKETTFKRYLK